MKKIPLILILLASTAWASHIENPSAGGGSSVYPATATAQFPFGMAVSTIQFDDASVQNTAAYPFICGDSNLFVGVNAGNNDPTQCIANSGSNTFLGNASGQSVASSFNTGVGASAMNAGGGGGRNAAFGYNAMSTSGENAESNTAIGMEAMAISGFWPGFNTAIGRGAGYGLDGSSPVISGKGNVFLGADATGCTATDVSYSVALGYGAKVCTDNTVVIGDYSGPHEMNVKMSSISVNHGIRFGDGSFQSTAYLGGALVLPSSGIAFGSASNTVASDTNTLVYSQSAYALHVGSNPYNLNPTFDSSLGSGIRAWNTTSGTSHSPLTRINPFSDSTNYAYESYNGLPWNIFTNSRFYITQDTVNGVVFDSRKSATAANWKIANGLGLNYLELASTGVYVGGNLTMNGSLGVNSSSFTFRGGTASQFIRTDANKNLISSATVTTTDLSGVLASAQLPDIVTANQYGSASVVPVVTFDSKGRITAVSSATVSASGSGIVSPGTFTWTNQQGISVSTLTVTSTATIKSLTTGTTDFGTYGSSGTITFNLALGNTGIVVLTSSCTFNGPSNPVDNAQFTFRVKQDAGGSRTATWASGAGNFDFGTTLTSITLTTTASKTDLIRAIYDAVANRWHLVAVAQGF